MTLARTFSLGLIGHPLGHSLSPQIHQAALAEAGLAGSYRLLPISPDAPGVAELRRTLDDLRRGIWQGLNVTIPHKQTVLPFMDQLTPTARAIGAVNTIWCENGCLWGDNTDVPGFWADLQTLLPSNLPAQPRAWVLGAGGSARAVVYALAQHGWAVTLAARRLEQAQALAAELSAALPACKLGLIWPVALEASALAQAPAPHLVVNTTPLGMSPHPEGNPWPAGLPLFASAAVYDLVYNPPETDLVRQARANGQPAQNGLGMLIEQAALAFERWTSTPASRCGMRNAARQALYGGSV